MSLATYVLRLADDALILSHRLGEWVTRAPQLEEDVALANISLDLLGQARSFFSYAGTIDGSSRTEDGYAYFRNEREFLNVQLVELENGDFARTLARQLFFSAYQYELYARLSDSPDPTLAAIAAKAFKEVSYHRDHAAQWVLRLGDGTAESHDRMVAGIEDVLPYVPELFDSDPVEQSLEAAVDSSTLWKPWAGFVVDILGQATLTGPATSIAEQTPESLPFRATGGRNGVHTEALGFLLAEMQHLARSHPGATW